jgi:DNA-binding response OmpR family regulator
MASVLLVDGDAQRRLDLWDRLVEEGHRVEMAALGAEALSKAAAGGICLVLLDVALADGDGLSVCQQLRRLGYTGTLILLADPERARECVLGLRAGADDVLTRPFQLVELFARIEACLRRRPVPHVHANPTLRFGDVEVDLCDARVAKAGRPVPLSPREFQLLRCLVERAGRPVSRLELLDRAWGEDATPSPQTVDVHVAWLRRKLETDPRHPVLIRTVHGIGYVLSDPGAS